ncbi:MAG: vitamin K epoxide reductase family protein [Gaiellales bacterium]
MRSWPAADRCAQAALAGLALAGLGIAAYLTFARYADVAIACSTGGCETVQSSRYATVADIPVAVLGLVGYAAILASVSGSGPRSRTVTASLSAVGAGFSLYLIVLQASVIGAFCVWCLASDVLLCVILLLALARLYVPQPAGRTST